VHQRYRQDRMLVAPQYNAESALMAERLRRVASNSLSPPILPDSAALLLTLRLVPIFCGWLRRKPFVRIGAQLHYATSLLI
jgi:hypothetical protein